MANNKEFSFEGVAKASLEKIGDIAKEMVYKGNKNKEGHKAKMKIPHGKILGGAVTAVALLTPFSLLSIAGMGSVGAIHMGVRKLISDSINRESSANLAKSKDAEAWNTFNETKDLQVMQSLIDQPDFSESSLHALARNKNTPETILSAIYAKILNAPAQGEGTIAGMTKVREALMDNDNTHSDIKKNITINDRFAQSPEREMNNQEKEKMKQDSNKEASITSTLSEVLQGDNSGIETPTIKA